MDDKTLEDISDLFGKVGKSMEAQLKAMMTMKLEIDEKINHLNARLDAQSARIRALESGQVAES